MGGEGIGAHLGHASRPDPSLVDVEGIEVVHQVVRQLVGEREPLTARWLAAAHQDQRAIADADAEAVDRLGKRREIHIQPQPLLEHLRQWPERPIPEPQRPAHLAGQPPALVNRRPPGRPRPAAPPPVRPQPPPRAGPGLGRGRSPGRGRPLGRRRPSGRRRPEDRVEQLVEPDQRLGPSEGPVHRARVTEMAEPRRDRQHGPLPGAEQVEDRDAEDLGQLRQLQRADRPYTRLDPRHRRLGQPDPRGQLPLRPALPAASVRDPLTEFVLADSLHLGITWRTSVRMREKHTPLRSMRKAGRQACAQPVELSKPSGHTAGVAVIVVCILVVLAGLVATVRWAA